MTWIYGEYGQNDVEERRVTIGRFWFHLIFSHGNYLRFKNDIYMYLHELEVGVYSIAQF